MKKGIIGTIIKVIITLIIILAIAALFMKKVDFAKSVKTTVNAVLTDDKTISELNTLNVPYAGIYQKKNDDGKIEQIIAYKGNVNFGIDFDKITINENTEENIIEVVLPPVSLIETYIEPRSISSIPDGTVLDLKDRIKLCEKDLIDKFENDIEMKKLASDSAKETITNFLTPIIESIDSKTKIVVRI